MKQYVEEQVSAGGYISAAEHRDIDSWLNQ